LLLLKLLYFLHDLIVKIRVITYRNMTNIVNGDKNGVILDCDLAESVISLR